MVPLVCSALLLGTALGMRFRSRWPQHLDSRDCGRSCSVWPSSRLLVRGDCPNRRRHVQDSNGHPTQNSAVGRSPAQALLNTGAHPIPRIGPHRSQIIVRLLRVVIPRIKRDAIGRAQFPVPHIANVQAPAGAAPTCRVAHRGSDGQICRRSKARCHRHAGGR
jgi:hypothetical protein